MVISCIALFVALGGAGYAATRLPANSVGNRQLKNNSVGNKKLKNNAVGPHKIINGSVGARQVNSSQVQLRVATGCSAGAVKAVGLSGSVSCTPTLPNEFGTSATPVTLGTGSTSVASESLPGGSSYLVLANPHAVISGDATQHVEVSCTVSVPSTSAPSSPPTLTKTLAVDLRSGTESQAATIPLVLPVPSQSSAQSATVSCSASSLPTTPAPTVKVDTTINAIQTASNS